MLKKTIQSKRTVTFANVKHSFGQKKNEAEIKPSSMCVRHL